MDGEKVEKSNNAVTAGGGGTKKTMSSSQDEAMKKCLEENQDDHTKCKSKIDAYKSSSRIKKPLTPLKLRSGSLTDV